MAVDRMRASPETGQGARLLAAVVLAALIAATLAESPAAAASAEGCRVRDAATGRTYARLQAAVEAARPGERLFVKGTCRGRTIIRKDIRLVGLRSHGRRAPRLIEGVPVLLIERGVKVRLRNLNVRTPGRALVNHGTTIATDIQVKGGRGIKNTGKLWLLGASSVRRTYGGVRNSGRLVLSGTTAIRGNDRYNITISVRNSGTLVMNGRSSIGNNGWFGSLGSRGAGILNRGRMVMNHRSSLDDQGGASAVTNQGTLVMNDHSSIHHNSEGGEYLGSGGTGGGVDNDGTLVMNDNSSIHHNSLLDSWDHRVPGRGGGVYNTGTFIMRGSAAVRDNGPWKDEETVEGGGLFSRGGKLVGVRCGPGTLANVYRNLPDDCHIQ